jgi:thiol:disulfide interchange protein DsbD
MFRITSRASAAACAFLLLATVSGRAGAQRGALSGTLGAHRTSPTSDTVSLRLTLRMTPGWHIGAARPGAFGVPTELTWRLPAGWRILTPEWPAPTAAVIGRDTVFEYRAPLTIETTLVTDGPHHSGRIQAVATYGICREMCIPGRLTLATVVR